MATLGKPGLNRLLLSDIVYPAPCVHGGEISLKGADLAALLRDLWAVQPPAVRRRCSLDDVLANTGVVAGQHLNCCQVTKLPKERWGVSGGNGNYISVTGRKGSPFAKHHRGASMSRSQPPTSPGFKGNPPSTARPRSSSRHKRPRTPTGDPNFDYASSPPASPGSEVGNAQCKVDVHRWAGLAVSQPESSHSSSHVLHCCGNRDCICLAHRLLVHYIGFLAGAQLKGGRAGDCGATAAEARCRTARAGGGAHGARSTQCWLH